MSGPTNALLRINAWGAGAKVTAGSSSTAATALPTGAIKVFMKATEMAHIRFGDSTVGEATTDDQYLSADESAVIDIPQGTTHFRAIRGGADDANVHYVAVNP